MRTGIALGSNLGDRLANLRRAHAAVLPLGSPPVLTSPVYETEPVGCDPGTAPYLNAVVEMEFNGPPQALLAALTAIELDMGRPSRRPRNAPRLIDLDVLYCGDLAVTEPDFILPHPRMHERRFVLAPLTDLRPDLLLPGHRDTVREMLANLPETPHVERTSFSLQ